MTERFSIFYAGQLLPGCERDTVRAGLGQLFKASEAQLDSLFSGDPVAVKRGCDRATAAKYQQAMREAGAEPIIRRESAVPTPPAEPATSSQGATGGKPSMAERLAAITGEVPAADCSPAQLSASPVRNPGGDDDTDFSVAAPGSPVLNAAERVDPVPANIDTTSLSVEPPADRLSPPRPEPPPPPDTSALALGPAGDTIPGLDRPTVESPDVGHLDLSPAGTDFSDCAGSQPPAPVLDLTGLELGPAGADVLEAQYRRQENAAPPDTGHLSLSE